MSLPEELGERVPQDHIEALRDAIPWSLDHAFDDLATLERAHAEDNVADWQDLAFLGGLPPRYRHRYNVGFARAFVVCLVVATHKMTDPHEVGERMFSCVAEELAAHLVIREAEILLAFHRDERGIEEGPIEFGAFYDLMFEDEDFRWLYQADMDGIEDDPEAIRHYAIAHLAFGEWFMPFSERRVHPYVEGSGAERKDP